MAINMPSIGVYIKQLAQTVVERSSKGKLLLVVNDDTATGDAVERYTDLSQVDPTHYTDSNYNDIAITFLGAPSEVIVVKQKTAQTFAKDIVPLIATIKFDYIAALSKEATQHTAIINYVKAENKKVQKKKKAVVYKATAPNDKRIINFVTDKYNTVSGQNKEGWHLMGRIDGIIAGLPMTQSVTYKVLGEIESVSEPVDMDAEVELGHLFLWNDEDGVRLSRGVNSLTSLADGDTEDMRMITIIEAIDMIEYDLRTTFKRQFVGKKKNKYDNQCLFINAVLRYFDELEREDVLDEEFNNTADIDVEAQRLAWIGLGKDEAKNWDDLTVKKRTFRRSMFLKGSVKILDALEDLTFNIYME